MQDANWAQAVKSCYLFSGAEPDSLDALARASRVIRSEAGETLFQTGDSADGLRIVLTGLVRVWISDTEGHELTLALLEPGDPFGEIALLDGLPRSANATAVERSECLMLPCKAVEEVLAHDLALARHLIQLLCELLRRSTAAMGGFAFSGLDGRLALKLHELALAHGTVEAGTARLNRKFSQSELGAMLGVSREAVNKRMTALAHDRLICVEGGFIRIPDLAALEARARAEARLGT